VNEEDLECPRWLVRVRSPASAKDPRAVLDIPAALQVEPKGSGSLTLYIALGDPEIEALYDRLCDHGKTHPHTSITVTLHGHALALNPTMRAELEAALAALLIGEVCGCPVSTEAIDTLQ
jgi:hypothetical protein